ncbi:MAG: DUF1446 domain-containing protein [Firmicutes bacterium]|nr:DUF1446 domain-containing protein [Bacillota bacterium]
MNELRVLAPTAILGYGFPEASFAEGMKRKPHVIAVDAGSTDPGPYYLGSGKSFTDRNAVKRDLEYMIKAGVENNIPVIIGSAGGSGADSHLDWNADIVLEIAREQGLTFNLGIISAQISKEIVLQHFHTGGLKSMSSVPPITEEQIISSSNIVAQMGCEPFTKALEKGAQVIVAGRAYDPTVFACLAIKNGFDEGLALHMGKILECATIACVPGSGSDCMFGTLYDDYFVLEPLSDVRKCTTLSVAAHTLYEKSDPTKLPGPGGVLDLTDCVFEQLTDNSVKVSGTKFIPDKEYYVKLEGAALKGYRTVSIAAASDPIFIEKINSIVSAVKDRVESNFANFGTDEYFLDFKVFGKNGVMLMGGNPDTAQPAEICIVIESVAKTPEMANTICSFARSSLLHFGYEGRKSTAGNLAFPFSPSDFEAGEVFNFSVYCLMRATDPCEYFPVNVRLCERGELK